MGVMTPITYHREVESLERGNTAHTLMTQVRLLVSLLHSPSPCSQKWELKVSFLV